MTRLLVPELEARRHLIEGYAQFPDVPDDVTNLDGVGLAVAAAGRAVGSVDLDNSQSLTT